MSAGTEVIKAAPEQKSLLQLMSSAAGLEPEKYYAAIKRSCGCNGATDADFSVLMMTANVYGLNPMLRQLYLMQTKRAIEVVIPIDGWVPLLVNHPGYLAHDVVLRWEKEPFVSKCVAATTRIWTKSRHDMGLGPFEHTEMMAECRRDTGPWNSHQTRMLGHKSVIQAARRCFGIYVMDSDEAERIGDTEPVPVRQQSTDSRKLTVQVSQTLPDDETVEVESAPPTGAAEILSEDVDYGPAFEGLARRVELCADQKTAAQLAMEIAEYLQDQGLTQEGADELAARLRGDE